METTSSNTGFFSKSNDLRNRIIFTVLMLCVYRLGTYIPLPGVDAQSLQTLMQSNQKGLLGMFNVFSGGAVQRMAIFALGIMPYISSSIIVQLLTGVSAYFKNLKNQGEVGRKKITQYTRYGTVLLATVQGYGVAIGLENSAVVIDASGFFKVTTVISLVAGTIFLMWLGEQITQRGIGNGISLIIFSGIVAEIPRALASTFELGRTGALSASTILLIVLLLLCTVAFIVFIERAVRKILINYPKRQMGTKIYGGETSHLPLKINTAGVIPAIFASALLLLPITFSNFSLSSDSEFFMNISGLLSQGKPLYMIFYASGIIFFSFFYTSIVFNPKETAENLRKHGGYVPGIRPGERTAYFIEEILTRLTTIGALYLTLVCLMPEFLISRYPIPFYLGGTSVLIVVVVAMDTVSQVQTRLMSQQYESLIKKTRFGK